MKQAAQFSVATLIGFWGFVATALAAGGSGAQGNFNPSDQDDPILANKVWRASSAVDPSAWSANRLISTRISVSNDAGKTFTDAGLANLGVDLSLNGYSWVYESSALVYDPADPNPALSWKVIFDRHLLNPNQAGDHRDFSNGWLGMRGAETPAATWADETKLLAGTLYNSGNSLAPGNPAIYPLPSALGDCTALTEPTALTASDGFYLAFHCHIGTTVAASRIALVRVRHSATGLSLEVKGTLLGGSDAASVASGYGAVVTELGQTIGFGSPSLVSANGKTYLLATPMSASKEMGCLVFEVLNLETAALVRTAAGVPQAFEYVGGNSGSFRGGCTAASHGTGGGIALSQVVSGAKPFTIVPTMLQLP